MLTALGIFTLVHVIISLLAIAAGFVALAAMIAGRVSRWTGFFLTTTVLTSLTGFGFPVDRVMPSHVFGVLSLIALGVAIYALYVRKLAGRWRPAYVVTALLAQYLNCFVLVVQSFLKLPPLKAIAPTQSEPPFAIAQLLLLAVFIALGYLALKRFRVKSVSTV